jgi:hypothetical protein
LTFEQVVKKRGGNRRDDHKAGDLEQVRRLTKHLTDRLVLFGPGLLDNGFVPARKPVQRGGAGEVQTCSHQDQRRDRTEDRYALGDQASGDSPESAGAPDFPERPFCRVRIVMLVHQGPERRREKQVYGEDMQIDGAGRRLWVSEEEAALSDLQNPAREKTEGSEPIRSHGPDQARTAEAGQDRKQRGGEGH